jgi:CubicO group peptidase (beta-lactamase class C family)
MRVVGLFVLALCAAAPAHADPRAEQIMYLLGVEREHHHIAGIGVVVVLDGQVIALDVRGVRDVEHRAPVTLDTVFPIGAVTQAFTALAAGLAHDEGVLSLDDPPARWLPYFQMQDREAGARVTLRDLLSHRTGLRAFGDLAAVPDVLSREDYLRAAIGAMPVAPPRTGYHESTAMVTAAGEAVARAYRTTWERVIETRIFAPLGMSASRTSALQLGPQGAVGYAWDGAAWRPAAPPASLRVTAPAGGIASSTRDMARWLRMLAGGGMLDGTRLVSAAALRELTTPQVAINGTLSYAPGWAVYDWNGHRVIERGGGTDGISALVSVMPDRHSGFVVLTNSSPTALTEAGVLGAKLWPVIFGESPRTPAPIPPAAAGAPEPAPRAERQDLPGVNELIARVIQAAGGRATLARHTSMQLRARGGYLHQGVQIELVGTYHAGKQVIDEAWRAAGKPIGRVRTYFDGARGAVQTTFGRDEALAGEREAVARRDAVLHPLLDVAAHYASVRVDRRVVLGGEDAFVLVLTPRLGPAVELYVAAQSARIVRRDSGGESTRFSDFRTVDREVVPFTRITTGPLGDKVVTVKQLRFGVKPAAALFGPVKKLAR